MKKSIKNKMSMYQMVHDIVKDHQPVWENTPKFVSAFDSYITLLDTLKSHAEKQRSYILGVRESRDNMRKETAEFAVRVASALIAFGEDTKNTELIALMKITEPQLIRRSHSDTVILIDRILVHAQIHANDLVDYGISTENLIELLERRDNLVVNILSPRKAILKRKDSSKHIERLSVELDQLLKNKLDTLVKVLRPNSEAFYTEYTNSRMVLSYGSSGSSNTEPPIAPTNAGY